MRKRIMLIIFCVLFLTLIFCIFKYYSAKKVNNNSLFKEEINKITIKYYPYYNLSTGNVLNELHNNYIRMIELDLNNDDIVKLTPFLLNLKQTNFDFASCDCVYSLDDYQLLINDKYTLSFGNKFGKYNNITFDVTSEFKDIINNIQDKYNNENIYNDIHSKNISFEIDNNIFNVIKENEIDTINSYKYFKVNDEKSNYLEDYKIIVNLDNDVKLYLYDADFGYLLNPTGESNYVIILPFNGVALLDYLEIVYNNQKLNLDKKLMVDDIKIEFNNEIYNINDTEIISEITDELKYIPYNKYSYLEDMTESNFSNGYIKIFFNNCRYYIPENSSNGNRFFVDEDGIIYDASYLNIFEKYVKDAIGYE